MSPQPPTPIMGVLTIFAIVAVPALLVYLTRNEPMRRRDRLLMDATCAVVMVAWLAAQVIR